MTDDTPRDPLAALRTAAGQYLYEGIALRGQEAKAHRHVAAVEDEAYELGRLATLDATRPSDPCCTDATGMPVGCEHARPSGDEALRDKAKSVVDVTDCILPWTYTEQEEIQSAVLGLRNALESDS